MLRRACLLIKHISLPAVECGSGQSSAWRSKAWQSVPSLQSAYLLRTFASEGPGDGQTAAQASDAPAGDPQLAAVLDEHPRSGQASGAPPAAAGTDVAPARSAEPKYIQLTESAETFNVDGKTEQRVEPACQHPTPGAASKEEAAAPDDADWPTAGAALQLLAGPVWLELLNEAQPIKPLWSLLESLYGSGHGKAALVVLRKRGAPGVSAQQLQEALPDVLSQSAHLLPMRMLTAAAACLLRANRSTSEENRVQVLRDPEISEEVEVALEAVQSAAEGRLAHCTEKELLHFLSIMQQLGVRLTHGAAVAAAHRASWYLPKLTIAHAITLARGLKYDVGIPEVKDVFRRLTAQALANPGSFPALYYAMHLRDMSDAQLLPPREMLDCIRNGDGRGRGIGKFTGGALAALVHGMARGRIFDRKILEAAAARAVWMASTGGLMLRTSVDILHSFAHLDFPLNAEQAAPIQARYLECVAALKERMESNHIVRYLYGSAVLGHLSALHCRDLMEDLLAKQLLPSPELLQKKATQMLKAAALASLSEAGAATGDPALMLPPVVHDICASAVKPILRLPPPSGMREAMVAILDRMGLQEVRQWVPVWDGAVHVHVAARAPDGRVLAFCQTDPTMYTEAAAGDGVQRPLGSLRTARQLLAAAGYCVITVPNWEWHSLSAAAPAKDAAAYRAARDAKREAFLSRLMQEASADGQAGKP
ncbi:hypothetical protein WJX81_004217 [Elliptochloris bilobata]|uniref:RAP domain-containing protein n=1 Tax=Elliptochloris bilobata TaxID=381761 RepID=A0AAW1S1B1_9CHLO